MYRIRYGRIPADTDTVPYGYGGYGSAEGADGTARIRIRPYTAYGWYGRRRTIYSPGTDPLAAIPTGNMLPELEATCCTDHRWTAGHLTLIPQDLLNRIPLSGPKFTRNCNGYHPKLIKIYPNL